jgi:hypothetical protein
MRIGMRIWELFYDDVIPFPDRTKSRFKRSSFVIFKKGLNALLSSLATKRLRVGMVITKGFYSLPTHLESIGGYNFVRPKFSLKFFRSKAFCSKRNCSS